MKFKKILDQFFKRPACIILVINVFSFYFFIWIMMCVAYYYYCYIIPQDKENTVSPMQVFFLESILYSGYVLVTN